MTSPTPMWDSEILYLLHANASRTTGVLQTEHVAPDQHQNQSRIRVLLVGDSFTYGWGSADFDSRWPRLLEDRLNATTADGAFEVVTLARGGASSFTQSEWLTDLRSGRFDTLTGASSIAALRMPFDALVVGFVGNDVLANEYDQVASSFNTPIVDPNRLLEVLRSPDRNPHWPAFADAVASMDLGYPAVKLWAPLEYVPPIKDELSLVREVFSGEGFAEVRMDTTNSLLTDHTVSELAVHPADLHPGPALNAAYAADVAAALITALDPERLGAAIAAASPPTRSVVSNFTPVIASLDRLSPAEFFFNVPDTSSLRIPCTDPAGCCLRDSESTDTPCGPEQGLVFVLDGRITEPQLVSCAPLGRPHAQVGLDRMLPPGTQIALTLVSGVELDVSTFGFDDNGFRHDVSRGRLRPGEMTVLSTGPEFSGVVLTQPTNNGCLGPRQEPPHLAAFKLHIERL